MQWHACFRRTLVYSLNNSLTVLGANTHNVNVTAGICDGNELSVVGEAEGVDGIAIPKIVRIRSKQVR